METAIQTHNQRPAAVWSAGGRDYDQISRGIADSIEHCVMRLDPKPGERILDLATGTGWTSRLVARRGAQVIGADIASELIAAAKAQAEVEGLAIDYWAMPKACRLPTVSSMLSSRPAASCLPADRSRPQPSWRVSRAKAAASR